MLGAEKCSPIQQGKLIWWKSENLKQLFVIQRANTNHVIIYHPHGYYNGALSAIFRI